MNEAKGHNEFHPDLFKSESGSTFECLGQEQLGPQSSLLILIDGGSKKWGSGSLPT